jgi:hypothetical protein
MSQEQDYFVHVVNETPIPVTLGSNSITVTGNINVLDTVTVNNPENNPVHVHVVETVEVEVKNDSGNPLPVSISNVSPIQVAVQQLSTNFALEIARGLVTGQYVETKNGYANGINANDEVTIWAESSIYPWVSLTTPQKLYTVSTSASDTGQTIRLEGLGANYAKITEDVVTNGLTPVATTQNFLRLNQAYTIAGTTNAGKITTHYGSSSGPIVGSMVIGFARNKGAFFTVPLGYTAYIMYGAATQFRGGSGNIGGVVKMFTRTPATPSGPFVLQYIAEVVNGHFRNDFAIPLAVPEKTDIDVRILVDGNGTQATCDWQMIMIPNS